MLGLRLTQKVRTVLEDSDSVKDHPSEETEEMAKHLSGMKKSSFGCMQRETVTCSPQDQVDSTDK